MRAKFFARNADVPMMIVAIGSGEKIAEVLPELGGLLHDPLMTLERVRVCKRDGELLATPHELPGTDEHGLAMWQKLMIYTSHSATHEGHPLHHAIIRRLRESDAAGATTLRGIWGFHGDHAPHGDKFFQIRRHVPVCTITIDTPERTAQAFKIIDELTPEHGLVTSEMVPAVRAMSEQRAYRRPAARQPRVLIAGQRSRQRTQAVTADLGLPGNASDRAERATRSLTASIGWQNCGTKIEPTSGIEPETSALPWRRSTS